MVTTATAVLPSPKDNRLLAALSAEGYKALLPSLEPLAMPLGLSVYESGGAQGYVYFPTTAIVSLLYVLADGASAEIAVTGNEGLVGIALFMGGQTTPSRAVVQSAGRGYRLSAAVVKKQFEEGGELQHLLLRFTQALITQMTQTAVCNRHHAVDQQLCRWLLLSLDRLPGNELVMTQEMKAVRDPVGRGNDAAILRAARGAALVVCAWGNHGAHGERAAQVLRLLRGLELKALRVNGSGHPAHPLYLPGDLKPLTFWPGIPALAAAAGRTPSSPPRSTRTRAPRAAGDR